LCYDFGTGVEQDDAKMVEWYVKAADLGDYCAAWQLSTIYEHGWRGVAVNKKEALKWCRVAAELEPHFAKDHQDRIVHLVREVATPRTNAA
jgi:TPR repeat protein